MIEQVYPYLPYLALTIILWLAQWAIRRWWPSIWEAYADLPLAVYLPSRLLRKVWQGLPSVVLGALVASVQAHDDPRVVVLGAIAGALAPLWHELLKALPGPYQGAQSSTHTD